MEIKTKNHKYNIPAFYIFIFIVISIKILLMGIFSSDYQNKLFMRFIDSFVKNIFNNSFTNPYRLLIDNNNLFPYPPLMLFIETLGGALISIFSSSNIFFNNILFKIPILFFDFLCLYYLMKLFPLKRKYIGILYFASPVILYSAYMHGQLDIIPTAFLIGSIYYMTSVSSKNQIKSILLLFAAVSCKLHILAVFPILLFYIQKKDGILKSIIHILIPLIFLALLIEPFYNKGFLYGVLFNNEQSVLTKVFVSYSSLRIYIPIIVMTLLYLFTMNIKSINKDLLYSLCGILFSVFLLFIPPMPGWYVWIIPFIAMFYIYLKYDRHWMLFVYGIFNFLYVFFFIFLHKKNYVDLYFLDKSLNFIKINNDILTNTVFTLLTGTLLYLTLIMFKSGVISNSLYKMKNLPFTIGISGDSGSGKSTLIEMFKNLFGTKDLLFIEGDGDHKWERGDQMWNVFTHLDPKANFIYRQADDIATLKTGQKILRVDYDHKTGKFTNQRLIKPKSYIILCGLHSLYLPKARKNLDLKIYMDIDENLRKYWKIERDTSSRGYDKKSILKQIESRLPDAQKYIYPQKKFADLIIQYFDPYLKNCLVDDYKVNLHLKLIVGTDINLEEFIRIIEKYKIKTNLNYDEDLRTQTLIFSGDDLEKNLTVPFYKIINELIPNYDEIIRSKFKIENNMQGILQFVIISLISNKLQGGSNNAKSNYF